MPRIVPCTVRFAGVVGIIDRLEPPAIGVPVFASPKSRSLAPPFVSITLPGFRSRWTTPSVVRLVERIADLARDGQRFRDGDWSAADASRQRLAFQMLEHEEERALIVADVVQRADVRMVQAADRARFALESIAERRVAGKLLGQDLDRHQPIQARVDSAIHFAHATRADGRIDAIRTQERARRKAHGGG